MGVIKQIVSAHNNRLSARDNLTKEMQYSVGMAGKIYYTSKKPFEIFKLLADGAKYFESAMARDNLRKRDGQEIFNLYEKIMERLRLKFKGPIGVGVFADPCEFLVAAHSIVKMTQKLQELLETTWRCSRTLPCRGSSCLLCNSVKIQKLGQKNLEAYSSQLSPYSSQEDFLEKTYDTECIVCLAYDLKEEGEYVFILNCRHMFCKDCFHNWSAHCNQPSLVCPACRQTVESAVSSTQFDALKKKMGKSKSLSRLLTWKSRLFVCKGCTIVLISVSFFLPIVVFTSPIWLVVGTIKGCQFLRRYLRNRSAPENNIIEV